MSRKIAFVGTHGVGKTILTFSVASRLRQLDVDADVAYENSRRSPFPINEATTLDGQMWILATQWKEELEASLRCKVVVCDRAVLDNYAYLVRACGRQADLEPFLRRWMTTYDILFHVPIVGEEIVEDSLRATAPRFQREIDGLVEELIRDFDVTPRLVRLPTDRDRHVALVLTSLAERGVVQLQGRLF